METLYCTERLAWKCSRAREEREREEEGEVGGEEREIVGKRRKRKQKPNSSGGTQRSVSSKCGIRCKSEGKRPDGGKRSCV